MESTYQSKLTALSDRERSANERLQKLQEVRKMLSIVISTFSVMTNFTKLPITPEKVLAIGQLGLSSVFSLIYRCKRKKPTTKDKSF